MRWIVLALLLAAPVVASAKEDEAKLQERLDKLEKENAKLREQLADKQKERQKLFDDATRAESGAGMIFGTTTAVASGTAPATTPPVQGAPTQHAVLRLQKAEITLDVSFGAARNVRSWRVHQGSCQVKKKGR